MLTKHLAGLLAYSVTALSQYEFDIPIKPSSPVVDISYPGFAFEQASFYNYAFSGDGSPNTFSANLINSVLNRTGGTPILRVGGTSGDLATVNFSQPVPVNRPATSNGPTTNPSLTLSPGYFDAFRMFPDSKYVFMVPLRQRNIDTTLQFAKLGLQAIGSRLQAIEIGNEPDFYDWFSNDAYASEFVRFEKALDGEFPDILGNRRVYQGMDGAWKGDANYNPSRSFTPETAFSSGLDSAGGISQVALHLYQSNDQPGKGITYLQNRIANHTAIVLNMQPIANAVAWLRSTKPDVGLIVSENGNSLGSMDIAQRNNLATCLWNIDYQLYGLAIGVTRVNNQQIVFPGFGMWVPVQSSWESPQVRANYYSQPFIADFIGKSGDTRVVEIPLHDSFISAYVAYDGDRPARIAIVNLALWTPDEGPRPSAQITVRSLPYDLDAAVSRLLSSPDGALDQDNLRYGGLRWTYENNGNEVMVSQQGREVKVTNGTMTIDVQAAGAVLVTL